MTDLNFQLEAKLREKELLVSALTERLEKAAEHLDRVQRSGGPLSPKSGGGVPTALVEEQQVLVEELQRAIQQWEDMQLDAAMGRVEMQLAEIRDLIIERVGPNSGATRDADAAPATAPSPERKPSTKPAPVSSPTSQLSGWEAMKASLLAGESVGADTGHASAHNSESAPTQASGERTAPERDPNAVVEPVDTPQSVNFEAVSFAQLQEAVEHRDRYIEFLLYRLSVAERLSTTLTADLAPEDLRVRYETATTELEEKLRRAEVDLSMERARLGREEARIAQMEEQVRKTMKKLGLAEASDKDEDDEDDPNSGKGGGRWLRMLGINKDQDGHGG